MGFNVNPDLSFPSDHAPVSVSLDFSKSACQPGWAELVERSRALGSYPEPQIAKRRKAIRYRHFDHDRFAQEMHAAQPPMLLSVDGLAEVTAFADAVYSCCKSTLLKAQEPDNSRPNKPKSR